MEIHRPSEKSKADGSGWGKRVPPEILREATATGVAANNTNVETDSRERKQRRPLPIAKSTLAVKAREASTGDHQPEVTSSRHRKPHWTRTESATRAHSQWRNQARKGPWLIITEGPPEPPPPGLNILYFETYKT